MYMKACSKCSAMFGYNEGEEWKKICIDCWKLEKNGKAPKKATTVKGQSYEQVLEKRIRQYEADIQALRFENAFLKKNTGPIFGGKNISNEDLKRIRMLVHPDKHGNSAMSNSMTQLINKLIN